MLDAYIIDRIRKEREEERARRSGYQPLHIERAPPVHRPAESDEQPDETDRGEVVIDYRL